MIRNIQRPWFEVWGSEEAQNRILKGLVTLFVALNCVQAIALAMISTKGPTLFAVSATETKTVSEGALSRDLIEIETKRALRSYIVFRHTWNSTSIDESFAKASRFIATSQAKTFRSATLSQAKLAKDKKISQKFYEDSLTLDLISNTAEIRGERVLMVEGLRAVNPQAFRITFEQGPRSTDNPEGIYITADTLIPENVERNQEAK